MPTKLEPMIGGSADAREMELLRQHGAEHARQEDVEQIEERADARDDRRVAVNRRRRQPVQPRGDRGSRIPGSPDRRFVSGTLLHGQMERKLLIWP